MKRLFILLLLCFAAIAAIPQDTLVNNSFLSAGFSLSIPVGEFASGDIKKINSGMTKQGFSIQVGLSHQFDEVLGFRSAFVYAQFPIKKIENNAGETSSIKPWSYYELLIGPMITGAVAKKVCLDLSVLSGTAFINATKINMNGATVARKYTSTAIPLNCALDCRFYFNESLYFVTGASYNYMRVHFNVTALSQDLSFKQSLNTVNVKAGMGVHF